ncbi:MAG: hypothetical protein Q9217_003368 [Psora testacea]
MACLGITGNVRNRFIQAAVLLHTLNPVRGEPTAYGLDQDPHDIETPRERLLKKKFLDSFALLCATKKDGDSVSAACIEEGLPQGTIIRIASNSGVRESTLSQLRELVNVLNNVASAACNIPDYDTEILVRIIKLDMVKIRHYFKDLCTNKSIFEQSVSAVQSRLMESLTSTSKAISQALENFLEWYGHIFSIKEVAVDPKPEVLIGYIRWALKGRRHFVEFLKAAFSTATQPLPRWVYTIFKLGRYGIASKALGQLASEFPSLFNPMTVEAVVPPSKTRFMVAKDEMPLTCVLRRVVGGRENEYRSRLARVWNTDNAESFFREACSLSLTVHAEMQLVGFYDFNREYKPSFRFMGVSKKSCYLCHMFLATHPDSFCVSSCHQKLYLSWMVPPAADSNIYKRYKAITTELSKIMEATAKQEIEGRLNCLRGNVPADSTAGVSLSGLTESSAPVMVIQASSRSQCDAAANPSATISPDIAMGRETIDLKSSIPPVSYVNLSSSSLPNKAQPATSNNALAAMPLEQHVGSHDLTSGFAMVFHFMRANNASRQDIVRIDDIVDPLTNLPSWARLVEILKTDDDFGLAFNEDCECLMVNNRIRVVNERQFCACLQYLRNSHTLNSEVLLCSRAANYTESLVAESENECCGP